MTDAGTETGPRDDHEAAAPPAAAPRAEPEDRWYEQSARDHPAASVLVVALLVALPVLVFVQGSGRWFYLDEWDFLSARSATNLGDLFRPHNENWSTIPILVYRGIFNVVHLHSYWPYEVPVVVAHLCVVGLLFVIMRRSGVNQWIALLAAGLLLFFGSGYENIVWGFQIGFTGALAFGLGQLVAADHDGPIGRRDGWGLALGLAALLCSSVAVTTVAVVGVATLLRRGWRAAAFHVVPLGVLYGIWYLLAKPSSPTNPFHTPTSQVARYVERWDVASVGDSLGHLGHWTVVGVALGAMIVVGLGLAWTRLGLRGIAQRQSMVVAMLVGFVVFTTLSGVGRWFFGTAYAASSRYLYLGVAFLLPAIGVAASTLVRRWRVMIPVVVVVMVAGVPGNIAAFDHQLPNATYTSVGQQYVNALASSPLIARVPAALRPSQGSYPDLTAGWLRTAWRQGWIDQHAVDPITASVVPVQLGIYQTDRPPPAGGHCQPVTSHLDLRPAVGDVFWVRPVSGHGVTLLPSFAVTTLSPAGTPNSYPVSFDPGYGNRFTVVVPGLWLRIKPNPTSLAPLALCR